MTTRRMKPIWMMISKFELRNILRKHPLIWCLCEVIRFILYVYVMTAFEIIAWEPLWQQVASYIFLWTLVIAAIVLVVYAIAWVIDIFWWL